MSATIEQVREFWDRQPCNIHHSLRPVGSADYFADVARRRYMVEPHIPVFADFPAWRGKRVLDVGCGIGIDALSFARYGANVTTVDLSWQSLSLAKQGFAAYDLPADGFIWGDMEALSHYGFPLRRPLDLIWCFGAIHHTPNPRRAIGELRRLCDMQTELRLMVYSTWSTKAIGNWLRGGWMGVRNFSEAQIGSPVTHTYTAEGVRHLLQGFKILEMRKAHIFPYRVEDYVRYRYVKQWYWRSMPPQIFDWVQTQLGWHWLVRAVPE